MSESPRDMLSRLKLIAFGDRDCDLSDNDEIALRWLITEYEKIGSGNPPTQEHAVSTGRSAAQKENSNVVAQTGSELP